MTLIKKIEYKIDVWCRPEDDDAPDYIKSINVVSTEEWFTKEELEHIAEHVGGFMVADICEEKIWYETI